MREVKTQALRSNQRARLCHMLAEHIAQGGRDAALFGYYATLLNDQRGVVEVPIAPAGV